MLYPIELWVREKTRQALVRSFGEMSLYLRRDMRSVKAVRRHRKWRRGGDKAAIQRGLRRLLGDSTMAPSSASMRRLRRVPCGAENPPSEPAEPTTRWQGTTMGKRFPLITFPTARAAPGEPARPASSP